MSLVITYFIEARNKLVKKKIELSSIEEQREIDKCTARLDETLRFILKYEDRNQSVLLISALIGDLEKLSYGQLVCFFLEVLKKE